MKQTTIYFLVDPRPGKRKGYVGKSNNPQQRFERHVQEARQGKHSPTCHRNHWIRALLELKMHPLLVVIDKVTETEWESWERFWIAYYQRQGWELTNTLPGGEGGDSETMKGLWKRPGYRAKMRATMSTPEYRAAASTASKRIWKDPKFCAKVSAALKSRWQDPISRARRIAGMSAAMKTPENRAKRAAAHRLHQDTFGSLIGTRMNKINLVVINAEEMGATVSEVTAVTGETKANISNQLSYVCLNKKLCTRKLDHGEFRYFAIPSLLAKAA